MRIIAVSVTFACVAVALAGAEAALAQDKVQDKPVVQDTMAPIIGTYMQNVACKGDSSDPAALKVTISPQEIVSNIGVCKILDTKNVGAGISVHVECKFPAGPLVGDITFTPQPDKTVKFVDRDNTYNAVLHRCPN